MKKRKTARLSPWSGPTIPCPMCGKMFYLQPYKAKRPGIKYCSSKCAGIGKRGKDNANWTRVDRECEWCGRTFSIRAKKKKTFCSRRCAADFKIDKFKTQDDPDRWVKCGTCGKDIYVIPWRIKANHKQYCDLECFNNRETRRKPILVEANCKECDEVFMASKYAIADGWGKFCSPSCAGTWQAKHHSSPYSRCKGGKRPDIGNQPFKSAWEANWARLLNYRKDGGQILGWKYEADTFRFPAKQKGRCKSYTPDFRISATDGTIYYDEVKGWMDETSKIKLDRMAHYYSEVDIRVQGAKEYRAAQKSMCDIIPNWEKS